MSIVVVVKKAGKAVIAADTLYGFGNTNLSQKYISKESKILRFENSFVGTVGAPAHDVVLRDLFETRPQEIQLNSKQEIFETYLKMHKILKEDYFLNTEEEEENKEYESSQIAGLIANPYGIFGMYTLREVFEFDRFWAIGSGTEFALGAMFAVYDTLDATAIAETGVKAACEFNDGCGLPFETHVVALSETTYEPKPKHKFKGKPKK